MNTVLAAIAVMRAKGLDASIILDVVEAIAGAPGAQVVAVPVIDEAAARRREADRMRKADARKVGVSADIPQISADGPPSPKKVSPHPSKNNPYPPTNSQIEDQARTQWPKDAFARFWAAWPDRKARGAALTAFEKIRKGGDVAFDRILAGVDAYKRHKPGDRDWCHASTWLNQSRYDDEWIDGAGWQQPLIGGANGYSASRGGSRQTVGSSVAAALARFEGERGRNLDGSSRDSGIPGADGRDAGPGDAPGRGDGSQSTAGSGAGRGGGSGALAGVLLEFVAGRGDDQDQAGGLGRGSAASADLGDPRGDQTLARGPADGEHEFHARSSRYL